MIMFECGALASRYFRRTGNCLSVAVWALWLIVRGLPITAEYQLSQARVRPRQREKKDAALKGRRYVGREGRAEVRPYIRQGRFRHALLCNEKYLTMPTGRARLAVAAERVGAQTTMFK